MLRERAIEAEVEISHKEVDISNRVWFNLFALAKQANLLQDALSHYKALLNSVLARLKMAIDEAEGCVVQSELHHAAALPAISKHVFHDIVLVCISHEATILLLDENDEENLAFANVFDFDVVFTKVGMDQVRLFFFLSRTLLPTKRYNVVPLIVREHGLKIQILRLSRMIPRDSQNIQWNLSKYQIAHLDGLVLVV